MMSPCWTEIAASPGIADGKRRLARHELRASEFESRDGSPQGILRFSIAAPQTIHTLATKDSRKARGSLTGVTSRTSAKLFASFGSNDVRLAHRVARLVRRSTQPDDRSGR